jgi:hypothetical protein
MKRVISIIGLLISTQFAFAQSLVATGDVYFAGDPITNIQHHVDVKNISNKGITVICQKTILSSPLTLPTWAGASYCFAGNCYSSASTTPSSTALLGSGQTFSYANNDLEAFSGYYDPAETTGITTVEYCFYDEINPSDNTCIIITYEISSASALNEINRISNFYPNPAKEIVYIDYYLNKQASLVVMDILGNVVKTIKLSEGGTQKLDVSDFAKGIYFGNVLVNSEIVTVKKIIVR